MPHHRYSYPVAQAFQFWDPAIENGRWKKHEQAAQIKEFFILLAVCHTVITEKDEKGNRKLQAESPDEAALVEAAEAFGFKFVVCQWH